jgi:hypothetical protein
MVVERVDHCREREEEEVRRRIPSEVKLKCGGQLELPAFTVRSQEHQIHKRLCFE